jgi:hypothetical protein
MVGWVYYVKESTMEMKHAGRMRRGLCEEVEQRGKQST